MIMLANSFKVIEKKPSMVLILDGFTCFSIIEAPMDAACILLWIPIV